MSYDLYVFDLPADVSVDDVVELLDDDDDAALAPKLQELVDDLARRWPGLADDADVEDSPWSSWPLEQSLAGGRGNAFNMSFSRADEVVVAAVEVAERLGLVVYDPQADEIIYPPAKRRRWFGR